MNARTFRDALSSFATGVTIVTTFELREDQSVLPVGMTASSFNSVSMDPPLILWSVTKSSLSAQTFRSAQHFSVHILASDQVELSNRFACRGTDKFAGVDYTWDRNNVPVIADVVTRFDCTTWNVVEGGDHWIIIGEVNNLVKLNKEPLVFSGGSYALASPLRSTPPATTASNPGPSPIDSLLLYNLSRAYHQMSQRFYRSVHSSGLSVPEWRILASLHSNARRKLPELAARTFIDPYVLLDMLIPMREAGLCDITGNIEQEHTKIEVTGTSSGHARVEHLFKLAHAQALSAVEDSGRAESNAEHPELDVLVSLLQKVITNTDESKTA